MMKKLPFISTYIQEEKFNDKRNFCAPNLLHSGAPLLGVPSVTDSLAFMEVASGMQRRSYSTKD